MKKNQYHWAIPLTGVVLFGAAVSAEQDKYTYLNSTNRVTLSLRFGLNIHSRFSGIGVGVIPGSGLTTSSGDAYNYNNGYVLNDSSGSFGGQTSYWSYESASQVNRAGYPANTIAFDRTTAAGVSSEASNGDKPYPGVELTYDREFGKKEDWHNLRYGLEAALNYMAISLNDYNNGTVNLTTTTDVYTFTAGTTPPAPYNNGPFNGPGFLLNTGGPGTPHAPATPVYPDYASSSVNSTFVSQDHFDANLWGGRLGPYLELPLTKNLDLRVSGGLAVGLLYGNESWTETLSPNPPVTGSGDAFETLWGYYASLDADWQISKRWAVDGALQFQDLGKFTHSFQGRQVELDLSRSLFVELGISYSF